MNRIIENASAVPADELITLFKSSRKIGLTDATVKINRSFYGANVFPKPQPTPLYMLFLQQFLNPLIYILVAAALLIFIFSSDNLDAFIITGVIVFNGFIGSLQEWRTESILYHLQDLTESFCLVLRNGEKKIIKENELVCGDILFIKQGQRIPADARIVETDYLTVDESSLTGESKPIAKVASTIHAEATIFEQKNMLFCGTMVLTGNAIAVICAVGKYTQLGHYTTSALKKQPSIPLHKELEHITFWILIGIFGLCTTLFIIGLYTAKPISELFGMLTGLFICVVPEGLPVVLTLILVSGVYRMAKRHALIKNLPVVETLGRTQIILTDKTGTITHNQMMISACYAGKTRWIIDGEGYQEKGNVYCLDQAISIKSLEKLGTVCLLMNRSSIAYQEHKAPLIIGDPLEIALSIFAKKIALKTELSNNQYKLVFDLPFESKTKYHAAVYSTVNGFELFVIGAPEVIIQNHLTDLFAKHNNLLAEGLRVVAVGSKPILINKLAFDQLSYGEKKSFVHTHILLGLDILGLCGMQDTIRTDICHSIERAKHAGIRVIMITGDHSETAQSVALSIGVGSSRYQPLDGYTIDTMNDEDLQSVLHYVTVYSRLSPFHKVRILEAYQKNGSIVAMVGDGINDVPTLLQANIGIVMGSNCTDITRESADLVLLNDAFSTIIDAIGQGRHIVYTLKRVIFYFFSTNLAEILIVVFAFLMDGFYGNSLPLPLTAGQILWLNLVTDGFLDIAISMEEEDPRLMQDALWAGNKQTLFDKKIALKAILSGSFMAICSLILFILYLANGTAYARSMALITMSLFQWFNAWNCRSDHISITRLTFSSNIWFIWIAFMVLFLQYMLLYYPFMQHIFKTVPLHSLDLLYAVLTASSIIIIEEIRKWYINID
ncbi:cation-transporting P-type ATPase [Candidatus Dependentiae bacterium]|nr:MAG: cation-transporting P-type ATPase [Candidatus Dependentiae bacterium]